MFMNEIVAAISIINNVAVGMAEISIIISFPLVLLGAL
jgi:hypothetical protein